MGIVRRIFVEKKEPFAVKAKELLEEYIQTGGAEEILYLAFSSGLSGTCGNIGMAARELMEEQEQAQQQLEEKMDRWVYLNDLAEQIESQNRNR